MTETKRLTNVQFSKEDKVFKQACKKAGTPPTARQASKYRRNKGLAFKKQKRRLPSTDVKVVWILKNRGG